MNDFKLYGEVVDYAKYLETLLLESRIMDEATLKVIRKQYIKPATNIAEEWVGVKGDIS